MITTYASPYIYLSSVEMFKYRSDTYNNQDTFDEYKNMYGMYNYNIRTTIVPYVKMRIDEIIINNNIFNYLQYKF